MLGLWTATLWGRRCRLPCSGVAPVGVMESCPLLWVVISPNLVWCHELGVWTPTLLLEVMDSPFLLWLLGLGLWNVPLPCGSSSRGCVLQGFCVPLQDSCAWVCHPELELTTRTVECGPSSCGYGVRHSNVTLILLGFGVVHGVGIMDSHTSVCRLRTATHRCGATSHGCGHTHTRALVCRFELRSWSPMHRCDFWTPTLP